MPSTWICAPGNICWSCDTMSPVLPDSIVGSRLVWHRSRRHLTAHHRCERVRIGLGRLLVRRDLVPQDLDLLRVGAIDLHRQNRAGERPLLRGDDHVVDAHRGGRHTIGLHDERHLAVSRRCPRWRRGRDHLRHALDGILHAVEEAHCAPFGSRPRVTRWIFRSMSLRQSESPMLCTKSRLGSVRPPTQSRRSSMRSVAARRHLTASCCRPRSSRARSW